MLDIMICPSCHKKITSFKVEYTVIANAYLDNNGKMKIYKEHCKNELDEKVDFNKKFPSYYCWTCNYFITHNDNFAEIILKEEKYKTSAKSDLYK